MVEVQYVGRMGNHLFTYAVARVIAEAMHYKLVAPPVVGFGGTYNIVNGAAYTAPVQRILGDEFFDIDALIGNKTRRKIFVRACCQKYSYFKSRAADIKYWYRQPPPEKPLPDDAVVLQVRLTDFAHKYKWAIAMDYYTSVLDQYCDGQPVFVITDEPTHPCLQVLEKYNPTYASATPIEDFRRLVAAKTLIIGPSTFAWWGAFLSNARVFAPLLARGYYSNPDYKNENFVVDDDDRYTYIDGVRMLHE